jgi:excisionase family DNA binding protein
MIISRLTDLLGEAKTGLFDLPGLFNEMGAAIKAKVSEDFEALGITLKQMFLGSISPTEETQKAIDERAAMGAIGDMNKYMQYQAAKSMRDAAASGGEAGSGAATGVGLGAGMGMGVGMAGMISQAMAGATQQPAAAAAAAAATPDVMTLTEAAAYLKVSSADVQSLITSGQVKAKQIGSEFRISRKALDDFLAS